MESGRGQQYVVRRHHARSRHVIRVHATSAAATSKPWHSVLGPESRLPNVYWGALSPGSLRNLATFTALPPVDQVVIDSEATYRYLRQDSALWSALHAGRLTTSRMKDALGLRDRTASRVVGGPQFPEPGVLKAYVHLCKPLYVPPPPPQPPSTTSGPPASPVAEGAAAAATASASQQCNEAARLAYNEMPRRGGGGVLVEDGGDPGECWSEADRRRISELAAFSAVGGGASMRLLWGSLQEGAAVATLALLFPTSQLEEVGLVCMPDPRPWGVDPQDLPPIGASPDAFITHRVPITHSDLQSARQRLMEAAGGDAVTASGAAARAAARSLLRTALARHTHLEAAEMEHRRDVVRSAAGAAGAESLTATQDGAQTVQQSFRERSLPLYASADSGALEWVAQQLASPTWDETGTSNNMTKGVAALGPNLVESPASGLQSASARTSAVAGPAHPTAVGCDVAAVVQLREVVEVKNHCPFLYRGQRKARKRGTVINFTVNDRGPQASVWPLWVPQLQAHMACSGADSALLLSRSPSRGVRVFRMFRDDVYVASMLALVRELQVAHVVCQQPPGTDPWASRPGYEAFLHHTVAIARGAEAIISTASTPYVPDTDTEAFWKMR